MAGAAPRVPDKGRHLAELSAEGRVWLATLGDQISEIERRWELTVGAPFGKGSEAYVAEARLADGTPAALKIAIAGRDPTRQELRILEAAEGRGYARLLRADAQANVLLMERLGPPPPALAPAKAP